MLSIIVPAMVFSYVASMHISTQKSQSLSIFRDERMIFKSNYNITSILVPSDGNYIQSNDFPLIFFTVSDPRFEGGSSIYVLEEIAPYEILEGGRDSTADYGSDKSVYFGARDGLYKYEPDILSAKRYGIFRDDIIQLQKANGTDTIFVLTADNKLYKIEQGGTIKTKVDAVSCALQFVLDTSNNIYYVNCKDRMIHIIYENGIKQCIIASVMEEFVNIKLLRPAFLMEKSVPFFGNGYLHFVYANGTSEKKDLFLEEMPTAFSLDASLYLAAALDGKIYEFNIMDVLINSMFNLNDSWPSDISKTVTSIMNTFKSNVYNYYNH